MNDNATTVCITALIAAVLITLMVLMYCNRARDIERDAEVAKAAIASGLVQQVIHPAYNQPVTIWVKSPAAPLVVEEAK